MTTTTNPTTSDTVAPSLLAPNYQTRLTLDPMHPQTAMIVQDICDAHRAVLSGLGAPGGGKGQPGRALFRIEPESLRERPQIIIQTKEQPGFWGHMLAGEGGPIIEIEGPIKMHELWDGLVEGQRYRFRLRASVEGEGRSCAKRKRLHLRRPADLFAWLHKSSASHGFTPDPTNTRIVIESPMRGVRHRNARPKGEHLVYINNIPYAANESALRQLFRPYGYREVAISRFCSAGGQMLSRGSGHVGFDDLAAARKAVEELHRTVLDGRTLKVSMGPRRGSGPAAFPALIDGVLTLDDCDKFRAVLQEGLGRGRTYGCGLITLSV